MARNPKQNPPPARENRSPAFIAWHVAGTPDKPFWTRIGAAWKHEDGVGMTLHLEAIPVGFTGRVVLREPKAKGAGA